MAWATDTSADAVIEVFSLPKNHHEAARCDGRRIGVKNVFPHHSQLCLVRPSFGRIASALRLNAQQLTLEGQTGGFLTPTAYVVYGEKGHFFSHPAIGFHFIDASTVIVAFQKYFSITESFRNRAEAGYTRSVHQFGDQPTATATPLGLSNLWNYSGMNVINGKVIALKDEHWRRVGSGNRRRWPGPHRRSLCFGRSQ